MIDNSDVCIFYYDKDYLPPKRRGFKNSAGLYQPNSGTRLAYEYALRKQRENINLRIVNVFF